MSKYVLQMLIGIVAGLALYVFFGWLIGFGAQATATGFFGGVAIAFILANLAGNRKVVLASGADKAKALEFVPPPGQALLVVRRDGLIAKLGGLNLSLDGREFAQIKSPAFTCLAIPPGAHTLSVGFGGFAGPQTKPGVYEFQSTAGGVVAVKVNINMGFARNAFRFTSETDLARLRAKLASVPMVIPAA